MLIEIIIKNLSKFFKMSSFASILLLVITTVIFPTAALSKAEVCRPIEMLLPFLGVINMVPIFLPEQEEAIYNSVAVRRISMTNMYSIRLMIAIVHIVIFEGAFCLFLKINECDLNAYIIWGGIASAFFMGSIVFFVAGISGNVINGVLAGVFYFICCYGLKEKLKVFYLFRMSTGVYEGKTWIFIAGIVLVIFTYAIMGVKKGRNYFASA